MIQLPYLQVDAFTENILEGNPCAVILDSDGMSQQKMQAIAREMNFSETAFVQTSQRADFKARYFTPAEEIPLAGHPTISTIFSLLYSNRLTLEQPLQTVTLELQAGVISVAIHSDQQKLQKIVMAQKKPTFLATYPPQTVAPIFGLQPQDLLENAPIQTVSTGTPQLMIPVKNLEALRKAQMDITAYNKLKQQGDFFSPHLFCLQGLTSKGNTFARHLGVPPDSREDPFTGSATGGMAAYLWHYQLIKQPSFIAEQGHWMNRPGTAYVEVVGSPENIETVKVGGKAVMVVEGKLFLDKLE